MPNIENEMRFCIINPQGGPVTIRLEANNALRAVGKFALFDAGNQPQEQWPMKAGDTGSADFTIQTPPQSLKRMVMTWAVLCCSMLPAVDRGIVSIQILQDGAPCPLTKTALWVLTDIANCQNSTKKKRIRNALTFLSE